MFGRVVDRVHAAMDARGLRLNPDHTDAPTELLIELTDVRVTDTLPVVLPPGRDPDLVTMAHTTWIDDGREAQVFLFGTTAGGRSVCVRSTRQFRPRVTVRLERGEASASAVARSLLQRFYEVSDYRVRYAPKLYGMELDDTGTTWREFCWLEMDLPTLQAARSVQKTARDRGLELGDAKTSFKLQACMQLGLGSPCGWIRARGVWTAATRWTTCDIELDDPISLAAEPAPPADLPTAGRRILSLDGEMASFTGLFPEALRGDLTFAIGASIWNTRVPSAQSLQVVLVCGCPFPLPDDADTLYLQFENATQMRREGLAALLEAVDPDVLTGWNIYGFDFPYWMQEERQDRQRPHERLAEEDLGLNLQKIWNMIPLKRRNELREPPTSFRLERAAGGVRLLSRLEHNDAKRDVELQSARALAKELVELIAETDVQLALRAYLATPVDEVPPLEGLSAGKQSLLARPINTRNISWSRFRGERCVLFERRMQSAAKGSNLYCMLASERMGGGRELPGRVQIDLMQVLKDLYKPPDNSLRYAAKRWLADREEKLSVKMHRLHEIGSGRGVPATQAEWLEIARYAGRDAAIPVWLISKMSIVPMFVQMARVCSMPMHDVINGGQQLRVYSCIAKFVAPGGAPEIPDLPEAMRRSPLPEHGFVINSQGRSGWPDDPEEGDYEGATVLKPKAGFYADEYVTTMDFNSLYPSIIAEQNLCFSTLLSSPMERAKVATRSFEIRHSARTQTYTFAKDIIGVLPRMVIYLVSARKQVKARMKLERDAFRKALLDAEQLALKVICNSVYGFTGTDPRSGMLSCKPVAAAVTTRGREMIDTIRREVERMYPGEADVVYGDTDSIMVKWSSIDSLEAAWARGNEAAKRLTALFGWPHKLENETVKRPFLLLSTPKTYAALQFEPGDAEGEVVIKGLDTVRRDRAGIVQATTGSVIEVLLRERSIDKARQVIAEALASLVCNRVDLDLLVLSKTLDDSYEDGGASQLHVQAWERMRARGDADIPPLGTRMPFVVLEPHTKKQPASQRTEHPEFVRSARLRPDLDYYIQALYNPLQKILQHTPMPLEEMFTVVRRERETDSACGFGRGGLLRHFASARVASTPEARREALIHKLMRCTGKRARSPTMAAAVADDRGIPQEQNGQRLLASAQAASASERDAASVPHGDS